MTQLPTIPINMGVFLTSKNIVFFLSFAYIFTDLIVEAPLHVQANSMRRLTLLNFVSETVKMLNIFNISK